MESKRKRVIIVGGGFGGVNLAKALAKNKAFDIIVVDIENYNFFPPLIYQVATSFIDFSNISYPFRKMFRKYKNIHFYLGKLLSIDHSIQQINTDTETLAYDYLVLAMGTETNYFGMENIKQHAFPLKTINDALELRNQMLLNLEKASQNKCNENEWAQCLNIVIAGAGPTGVELAGMISELEKEILSKEYPELLELKSNIYLVSPTPYLLPPMSRKSQEEALKTLTHLDVNMKLNVAVTDYVDRSVVLSDGEKIKTNTLIWAAGVIAKEAKGLAAESIGQGRRILVDDFNKVKGTENIFAIGDICLQTADENYKDGHPQLAQVAIQQAKLLAKNFSNIVNQKKLIPFRYVNKGNMAIISKHHAVVDLPKFFFKGYFAWLTWLFVHIIPIAGFRNKGKLLLEWFWNYVSNNSNLRFIIKNKCDEAKKE